MKTTIGTIPKRQGLLGCLAFAATLALSAQNSFGAGPIVQTVTPVLTLQNVRVTFAAAVDPTTAATAANYSFVGGTLPVRSAMAISSTVVDLYTGDQTPAGNYTLQISGVQDTGGTSMTTTQLNFTVSAMTISPVRYDAGTTITQPSGPPDPASSAAGSWLLGMSATAGMSVGAVPNDNSTGLNAWNLTDGSTASPSTVYYSQPISQTASAWWGRTNGWRIVIVSRMVNNFGYASPAQGLLCFNPGVSYGYTMGVNGTGQLIMKPNGGSTYTLTSDAYSYHTNITVFDPVRNAISYYFDGKCILDNGSQSGSSNTGLIIGSTSSSAAGSVNYNLIQMDVVGATRPVVLLNPTNAVLAKSGLTATFTASFSQFVNQLQWLSNGIPIPGANSGSYTTGPQTIANNGTQYSCLALSALGNVETARATVTVNDFAPAVETVSAVLTLQHIRVALSEAVDPTAAANMANYSLISDTLTLQRATLIEPSIVELLTSAPMGMGSAHTLRVSGLFPQGGSTLMTTTQLNFTVPQIGMSPIRYDAGTTITQPSGPTDPTTLGGGAPGGGYWSSAIGTAAGMSVGPVTDDNSTGLNAWNVTDATSAGNGYYYITMGPAASAQVLATNASRIVVISRLTDNFGYASGAQQFLYWIGGKEYGVAWSVDANGYLDVNVLGGSTYQVSSDPFNYHTNVMVYDPVSHLVSVYFDNTLVTDSSTGTSTSTAGQILFGSSNTSGKGGMNYNLVQLDVVNATQPVVLQNPASSTNAVGQYVTFTAAFSPFEYGYRWLSNGVPISGATGTSYTTGILDPSYNGAQFVCMALNGFGMAQTVPATLTITSDTTPPSIASVKGSLLGDRFIITFSEPILASYATDPANYTWLNAGVTNISVLMLDSVTVELRAGPFQPGSNYTVQVSNIRDTSNLIIANNSPASAACPGMSILAGYNAGDTVSAPAGPPDPTSPAGGNWSLILGTDPNISTNAVLDDLGTGLNAWNVTDATTATGQYATYYLPLANSVEDGARQLGWVLTVRARMTQYFGTEAAPTVDYYDYKMNRYVLGFNLDNNNEVITSLDSGDVTVTSDGSGLNYHLYQFVYDPASATASFYFDGNLVAAHLPESSYGAGTSQILWGTASSPGEGSLNVNLVQLSEVAPPFASLAAGGNTAQVSYRGILQSALQLGNPTVWTPVATNSTSGTNIYTIPASSHAQQFFRAKLQQ
jgi:hypothetical protein